jgi:hypothetical protein
MPDSKEYLRSGFKNEIGGATSVLQSARFQRADLGILPRYFFPQNAPRERWLEAS